jgi:hypothetical protein
VFEDDLSALAHEQAVQARQSLHTAPRLGEPWLNGSNLGVEGGSESRLKTGDEGEHDDK